MYIKLVTDDYWISNNEYLIFKPHFNKQPNKELLSKYNHIIFSNYDVPSITIKLNNQFKTKYFYEYVISKFNLEINLPNTLTHLSFGEKFNQIVNLPDSLQYLSFGNDFNQPVNLPDTLTHLVFGKKFNQVVNLPLELKYLKLSSNNEYMIDNLVSSIKELKINYPFNLELNNLPNGIRKIIFSNDYYNDKFYNRMGNFYHKNLNYYDKDLNSLPDSVEFIHLPIGYKKKYY
jgi:hypothetical protein